MRFTNEGVTALGEIFLTFVQEVLWRSMNQARNEGMISVNLDHLEKILPQLVRNIVKTIWYQDLLVYFL